ncbi:hypothetical protein ACFVXQ_10335 [Kitasatospora sp. NPDC058263]
MSMPPPDVTEDGLLEGIKFFLPDAEKVNGAIMVVGGVPVSGGRINDRISSAEIAEVLDSIASASEISESSITWPGRAEFMIMPLGRMGLFERFFDAKRIESQGENAISYSIGRPSKEFMTHLLCSVARFPELRRERRWAMLRRRAVEYRGKRIGRQLSDRFDGDSMLDFVAEISLSQTLTIESTKDRTDFEALANSFLFHAAYNLDMAARIGADPIYSTRPAQRGKRLQGDALEAPRQAYGTDLVHHYLMGVAADIPLLEFLAYYHIAEHFFGKVFNDDLVEMFRKGITDPSFSARRNKDIQQIIKLITSAQRQARDEGVDELKALQLVLSKFVSIDRLISDLNSHDASLVAHYRTCDAAFAGGPRVDLAAVDDEVVKKSLARRIYKVRNALVHAKEGDLPRYTPFAHDAELIMEIPLMRFIAEQVIIAHGKVI